MAVDGTCGLTDERDETRTQKAFDEKREQPGTSMRRRLPRLTVVVIVALSATTFKFWRDAHGPASVEVVRGEIQNVDIDGSLIRLADVPEEDALYLIGTGLPWQGLDEGWRESGQPECLPPFSSGATVEIGIVPEADREHPFVNLKPVVWVRCLTLPTEIRDFGHFQPPALDHAYQQALDRER